MCLKVAPDRYELVTDDRAELEEQLARRHEAALRLPPFGPCGCRDPESPDHLANRCRYPQRAA